MSADIGAARHAGSAFTRLFLAVAASAVFVKVLTATMINVLLPLMGNGSGPRRRPSRGA